MKNGYGTNKISTKESSGMKKSRIMKTTVLLLAMVLFMGVFPAGCAGKESGTESSGQGQITESAGQEPATGSAEQEQVTEDGTFQPALFRAEGGTGKVKITCEEVTVKEGAAEAVIEFSSPHYEWVKKDEVIYEPENAGAYLGKLMAELKVRKEENLPDVKDPFDRSSNQFASMIMAHGKTRASTTKRTGGHPSS